MATANPGRVPEASWCFSTAQTGLSQATVEEQAEDSSAEVDADSSTPSEELKFSDNESNTTPGDGADGARRVRGIARRPIQPSRTVAARGPREQRYTHGGMLPRHTRHPSKGW